MLHVCERPAFNQCSSGLQHPVEPFAAHMPALAHLHARAPCLFSVCDERITGEVKEAAATGTLVEPVSGFQGSWAEQRAGECCIFTNPSVLLRVTVSVRDCQ